MKITDFFAKKKLVLLISAVLLALCLIAVAVAAAHMGKAPTPETGSGDLSDVNVPAASDDPDETEGSADIIENGVLSIYLSEGDDRDAVELFSTSSPSAASPAFSVSNESADCALLIKNGLPADTGTTLILERNGEVSYRRDLIFEEGLCRVEDLPEGEYVLSLLLRDASGEIFYTASPGTFTEALALAGSTSLTVRMIGDICLPGEEELVISSPFVWELCGFSFDTAGDLRFISESEGEMRIINGSGDDIGCAGVYCDAPGWDFTVTVPFGNFCEERPFYIYAHSLNGESIDCGEVYVDTAEDWQAITKDGTLDVKPNIERIICDGAFTLTGTNIGRSITLVFRGNIGIDGVLSFSTTDTSPITIDNENNSTEISPKIHIDAPLSDVSWYGNDKPDFAFVEQYMNVLSYNGAETDAYMGGAGTSQLLSGSIKDTGTGTVIAFVPDGSVVDISTGYLDSIDPEKATITAELSADGSCRLEKKNGAYYCVVTDAHGGVRGYRVNFFAKDYRLPVIHITTDSGEAVTTKDYYVGGTFSIDYNGAYDFAEIDGAAMKIKCRGNSSFNLDKKPYKIKFEKGTSLFGLHKAKRWVLVANHVDRTLIRNKLAYSIGTVLDNLVFVPNAFMVDVFVNGKYQGVYQLSEQIEVNEGRVPGEENSDEVDTDYFLEIGGERTKTDFGSNVFSHELFRFLEIKNPDADTLTKEQYDYISGYVKSIEDAVMNGGDYESLMDVPSLIDWFLLYEFSYNLDGAFRRSDFLLKIKGDKLYFCTPWDFDYAFGNMNLDTSDYKEWICLGNPKTDAYDEYIKTNIMDYLLKDPAFTAQLKKRWAEVGEDMLARGLETVDYAESYVAPSAAENFKLWKIFGVKIQFEKRSVVKIPTYKGQLDYIRDFMKARYKWMDKTIKAM